MVKRKKVIDNVSDIQFGMTVVLLGLVLLFFRYILFELYLVTYETLIPTFTFFGYFSLILGLLQLWELS
jgi:hypothetical protein